MNRKSILGRGEDRRDQWFDRRRIAERREYVIDVSLERRFNPDRRDSSDRRSGVKRRKNERE